MPGSGKSTVSKFASEYGFDVVNMGDVIDVKYFGVDPRTRKDKVSMKALLPKPEGYVERPKRNFDTNNKRGGYNKGYNKNKS